MAHFSSRRAGESRRFSLALIFPVLSLLSQGCTSQGREAVSNRGKSGQPQNGRILQPETQLSRKVVKSLGKLHLNQQKENQRTLLPRNPTRERVWRLRGPHEILQGHTIQTEQQRYKRLRVSNQRRREEEERREDLHGLKLDKTGPPRQAESQRDRLSQNPNRIRGSSRSTAESRGSGYWSVKGTDFVDSEGNMIKFSGVNWQGFETPNAIVGGLQVRTYGSYLDQMKSLGFNAVRLPFAGETLEHTTYPNPGALGANPDLQGKTSLQCMDQIIRACWQRGIKVILDYHRMRLTVDSELGTWWDEEIPESTWLGNWGLLARRYRGWDNIIGVDLFNEVHSSPQLPEGVPLWTEEGGEYEKYNYRSAVLRAIDTIHAIEPEWIIFMEGFYSTGYWWGADCAKLLEAPIKEPADKLAYSAHDYGPYIATLPIFFNSTFPDGMPEVYKRFWGLIIEDKVAPLWIGEFGSVYPPNEGDKSQRERLNFEMQIDYIKKIGASWTIAFWGPDTKDTGSILQEDWTSVNQEKMTLLDPIMHPDFI